MDLKEVGCGRHGLDQSGSGWGQIWGGGPLVNVVMNLRVP